MFVPGWSRHAESGKPIGDDHMITLIRRGFENSRIYYWLVALFCMNFLGRGSIVCTMFAVYAVLRMPRKIILDFSAVCALFLSVAAFLASMVHYGIVESIKALNFFLMYLIGLNGYYASKDRAAFLEKTIFSIFSGYAIFVMLTWIGNLNGVRMSKNQLVINNIWTGERMATTLAGLLSAVVIGYFFYAMVCQPSKRKKLYALAALGATIALNMETATRTPLVLLAINLIVMTAIYLASQKGRKAVWAFLAIIAGTIVLAIAALRNAFGIWTRIITSPIFTRFAEEGLNSGRVNIMAEHFRLMLDYPWGGEKIKNAVGAHAHNFLQQGYDYYGVFAAIPLLILGVTLFYNMITLIKLKKKNRFDYLLISMYLSMLIQACLEPVFTGYPCFMFSLLLIHGMTNGYLKTRNGDFGESCAN